jgi:hypothetical protein
VDIVGCSERQRWLPELPIIVGVLRNYFCFACLYLPGRPLSIAGGGLPLKRHSLTGGVLDHRIL